jgi:hypothetical protein
MKYRRVRAQSESVEDTPVAVHVLGCKRTMFQLQFLLNSPHKCRGNVHLWSL